MKQIFNLEIEDYQSLKNHGVSLEGLYFLERLILNKPCLVSEFNGVIAQNLHRKGYIDHLSVPTVTGKTLYNLLTVHLDSEILTTVKEVKKQIESDFEKWWAIYPTTDSFTHNGRSFGKSRGLRVNKKKCEELFTKLVNSGKYTGHQIIEATKEDVRTRKEISVKKGTNSLTFMQNSATYLNQESFEPHIEGIGKTEETKPIDNSVFNI